MKTTTENAGSSVLEERVEMLKNGFDKASETSKEAIKEILKSCNVQAKSAVEVNQKIIDSAIHQLGAQKIDASYFHSLNDTIEKSVELSEEVIDSIIGSHNKRVDLTIDFNKKCLEALKEQSLAGHVNNEKLIQIFQDNFNESIQLSIKNMKGIIDMYNKHLNLSVNFGKNFSDSINSQLEFMSDTYNKQADVFNAWSSKWWEKSPENTGN